MNTAVRFFALMLALLLPALGLSGCHGSGGLPEFQIPDEMDGQRTIEITFWAKNDTNKRQTDIYDQAIRDFEALYPNIRVNMRLYTDYGKIYNDVITNIKTKTTPNVCITYPDHIATYLTGKNIVVPLDSLIDDPKWGLSGSEVRFDGPARDQIIPAYLAEGRIDGVQWALPFMRSTEACYVNRTFVEKLGFTLPETLTWDFVWEVSEAAMAKDGDGNFLINGQKVMIPFIYKSTDNMMIQMLRQKNAPYSTAEGEILVFSDATRELLKTVASHAQTGAFSTFKISSYPANFLNAGQCIFAVDSTAGATWMGSDAPLSDIAADRIVPFETAVYPVPQFDPEHPQMISQGPSICVFNKTDPQEVLAGWLFAQYLLCNKVQIAYAETEGYVPVTEKARQDASYQEYLNSAGIDNDAHYPVKIQATQLLIRHTEDTFVTPVFNGSASLRDAAGQMIEDVTKSVRRKKTVDDAFIDDLYRSVTSLYRLDQGGVRENLSGVRTLGELPGTARALLISLASAWALILAYVVLSAVKKKR